MAGQLDRGSTQLVSRMQPPLGWNRPSKGGREKTAAKVLSAGELMRLVSRSGSACGLAVWGRFSLTLLGCGEHHCSSARKPRTCCYQAMQKR